MGTNRPKHDTFMRQALALARKGYGLTSPNPMVGALLVRPGKVIGRGWHRAAGQSHAEIEAIDYARRNGHSTEGADLYVTLEPCSTHGRTPPCTDAIIAAGVRHVFIATTDPNPKHAGRGYDILRKAGIEVHTGILADESNRLNEAFNHWIVTRRPFVIAKAAMTLDGKIATANGASRWITNEKSRAIGMHLRLGADAILVGVNTIIADDPALTIRSNGLRRVRPLPRIILDPKGRTPTTAQVLNVGGSTIVVVGADCSARARKQLEKKTEVIELSRRGESLDLRKLMKLLGAREITSLLVEGGGETHWTFFEQRLVNRVAFFYAPKILGGRDARKAVAGPGFKSSEIAPRLRDVKWRRAGEDLILSALVEYKD